MAAERQDPTTVYLQQAGVLGTIEILTRVSSSLSLIGVIAVLAQIGKNWKEMNGTPQRILLWITLADIFYVPVGIMSRTYIDSPVGCTAQGILVSFGQMGSIMWGSLHATNVLLSVVFRFSTSQIMALEKWFHALAWGVSFLMTLLPMALASIPGVPLYGDAQLWCWYRIDYSSYRLTFCYGLVLALLGYCLIVYVLVGIRVWQDTGNKALQQSTKKSSSAVRRRYALRTSLYFLAFLLTWVFAAINRIRGIVLPTAPPLVPVVLLHAALKPAHGILNCIAYFAPTLLVPLFPSLATRPMSDGAQSTSRNIKDASAMLSVTRSGVPSTSALPSSPHSQSKS